MFGLMRNCYRWLKHRKERVITVALLGVDNAGKSTILHRLKGEIEEFVAPTIGFSSEVIKQGATTIKVFDLGGGASIRGIWPRYYSELYGAIFVVDSSDKDKAHVIREVLQQVLEHPRFAKKPLLILANKQDKAGSITTDEIAFNLGLEKFPDLDYNIITCTALLLEDTSPPDPNINQGLKWLTVAIDKNFSLLQKRIHKEMEEQKEEERIESEEKRKRVEARRRERELAREREEKEELEKEKEKEKEEKDKKKKQPPPSAAGHDKHHHHEDIKPDKEDVLTNSFMRESSKKEIAMFDKVHGVGGGDPLNAGEHDGIDIFASRSKQKTPRNNIYTTTPTTIIIKSDDGNDSNGADQNNSGEYNNTQIINEEEITNQKTHDGLNTNNINVLNDDVTPSPSPPSLAALPPLLQSGKKFDTLLLASPSIQTFNALPPLDKVAFV